MIQMKNEQKKNTRVKHKLDIHDDSIPQHLVDNGSQTILHSSNDMVNLLLKTSNLPTSRIYRMRVYTAEMLKIKFSIHKNYSPTLLHIMTDIYKRLFIAQNHMHDCVLTVCSLFPCEMGRHYSTPHIVVFEVDASHFLSC